MMRIKDDETDEAAMAVNGYLVEPERAIKISRASDYFCFLFLFADFIFAYLLSPYEAAALAASPECRPPTLYTGP